MATDVCIIYAHEDRPTAMALATLLTTHGWRVWWDDQIEHGQYPQHIEAELASARSVIAVWSKHSVGKTWVRDEARYTLECNTPLYPIRIDKVRLPVGFGQLQTIDIEDWNGGTQHPGAQRLIEVLERRLGPPSSKWDGKRAKQQLFGEKTVRLPCFARSVSSYETQLQPYACVTALNLLATDAVLVSAYDIIHAKHSSDIISALAEMKKRNTFIILDSGNYESYRTKDTSWNQRLFIKAVNRTPCDAVFCFDNLKPPKQPDRLVKDIVRRVQSDQELSGCEYILPIVHCPVDNGGKFQTSLLPEIFFKVAKELSSPLIAIPERELGDGILEKAIAVAKIRAKLNELSRYQPIHLLGTGNPLSIAVLTAAGADCFDGLEWCRTAIDHETGLLYHHQQYDFFRYQTRLSTSSVIQAAADEPTVSFKAKMAFHNLDFLNRWMDKVCAHTDAGTLDRLLVEFLPSGAFEDISKSLPEAFS